MTTIAQYIIMKDITTMDFQSVTIMHAMNVMIHYLDYYEAARIAYADGEYMRKYLDSQIDISEINKWYRPIWEFTCRMLYEEKKRVKVVSKSPDNLLVQWVPGWKDYD